MGVCHTCGNEYERTFDVITDEGRSTFDCFECAIQALAPRCAHCDCRVIGHGILVEDTIFCCAHCARQAGMPGARDHVDSATVGV